MLERILDLLFERHDIGRPGDGPYLTRWVIWGRKGKDGSRRYGEGQKVFLHRFHRGDAEPYFHDHPWAFWSLILWGGYWEQSVKGWHWYGPGRLLRRPAEWAHRVELPKGKRSWTLVWTGAKERGWGFWCSGGWIPWRKHAANIEAGSNGCGDEA